MTQAKRYKRYSAEFKREAILRAGEEGVTDKAVCDELGISTRQFRRWRDELQLLGIGNERQFRFGSNPAVGDDDRYVRSWEKADISEFCSEIHPPHFRSWG